MRTLLFHNPAAGRMKPPTVESLATLAKDQGGELTELPVHGASLHELLRAYLDGRTGLVVVAGGDGTVNAAAQVLAGRDVPLGIVPTGTRNHFARDAGIPLETEAAVRTAFGGADVRVDVGRVDGRVFVNNAAVGLYPDFVKEREHRRNWRKQARWRASLAAAALVWRKPRHLRVRVNASEHPPQWRTTPLLFVGNNEYETTIPRIGRRRSLRGGKLVMYVTKRNKPFSPVRLAVVALAGRLDSSSGLDVVTGSSFQIEAAQRGLSLSLDGEVTRAKPPLEFRIEPEALRIRVPRKQETAS